MTKRYTAEAVVIDKYGHVIHKAAQDYTLTLNEAENVLKSWQNDGYRLLVSWVEMNGNINRHKVHVNEYGDIKPMR